VGVELLGASVAFGLCEWLALRAAHCYVEPAVRGLPTRSDWFEPDFLLSLASAVLALAIAVVTRRAASAAPAFAAGSVTLRGALWLAFTVVFGLLWVDQLYLLTLLIAPAHALACLRVVGLWSRWRSERRWRSAR
jgi:hypothetical protein